MDIHNKKILLLGEYSGFFTNLKKGFEHLGIECTLASNGDGWKRISGSDFPMTGSLKGNSKFAQFYNLVIYPFINSKRFCGYDIVLLISPETFPVYINKLIYNRIRNSTERVFVSIAGGCCSLYESYIEGRLKYYTFDNNPELVKRFNYNLPRNRKKASVEKHIYKTVDGIIPIMFEYADGVRKYPNCKKTIPLPFDADSIPYSPNIVGEKIVIMHGVLREKSKGTDIIRKALDIIKEKYPNDVEIVIDGKKPLNEYLRLLRSVNILVDQCKEHCYGMNALYAMAEGRIVLGGASKQSLSEFGLSDCPVIHIEPNVEQIVSQIENVIKNRENIEDMGYRSRKFVEEFHNCDRIAKEYLNVFCESYGGNEE